MSSTGDVVRTFLRGLGQVLITLGLVVLLFVVYELKVTNLYTGRQQSALADELEDTWAALPTPAPGATGAPEPPEVPLGKAFARIYAPRLGRDFKKVVVEGTDVGDLKRGPGHYAGTAAPGEVGNVAIAGHRTTYGAPFHRIDELRDGDALVLETATQWFTYRVRGREVVPPSRVEVTLPVPNQRGAKATERLLTLTTCHPKYSARSRLVVYAVLEAAAPKSAGRPAGLTEPPGGA
jgi:sortase A